ncbi:uncharacterized protein LOC62_02G002038 [Vanrija pseudolonga]|uniref:Transmembrane protein n=1 Tax=Vanrija pseudolonga TaxID=143232 RepID=A0AAF1BFS0_9TREE|nr:hypothetical protein LOC62_02G002038 [Vanrija pseudolonga]
MPATRVQAGNSSYDDQPEEYISMEQFRQSMRLVRLQIAVPISVLISLGTSLVCSFVVKPGLGGVNRLFPTLVSPKTSLIGLYWAVLYGLQVGLALLVIIAQSDRTKAALIHGVGLRFAVINWLMAAWAVAWSLQFFIVAECLILAALLLIITIHITMLPYPVQFRHPFDALFIHATVSLYFAVLFELMWIHGGFVALGWIVTDSHRWERWTWQAVGAITGVNVMTAIYEAATRQSLLVVASEYLLVTLLLSAPKSEPRAPNESPPKPTPLLMALFFCLALHPIAITIGAWSKKTADLEGRIRLEQEAEAAQEAAEEAAAENPSHHRVAAAEEAAQHRAAASDAAANV